MRLIDRIALNRAIHMVLNFILSIFKMFDKKTPEDKPDGPVKPKPSSKRRPLKDLIDSIVPWREQK
jgi:hypothetical protein